MWHYIQLSFYINCVCSCTDHMEVRGHLAGVSPLYHAYSRKLSEVVKLDEQVFTHWTNFLAEEWEWEMRILQRETSASLQLCHYRKQQTPGNWKVLQESHARKRKALKPDASTRFWQFLRPPCRMRLKPESNRQEFTLTETDRLHRELWSST